MHIDRQEKRPRTATSKSSEAVELPYCEGIQVCAHSPVSLATSNDSAHEAFIAVSQVVMATETQQSPMLQTEASQEGTKEAFSLFDASVHICVHFAIAESFKW